MKRIKSPGPSNPHFLWIAEGDLDRNRDQQSGIDKDFIEPQVGQMQQLIHWADSMADRLIKERGGQEVITVASGITPSGTVHFGNFREAITVDFVARALKDRGQKVRFIFSWDDFDTFRKIPKNMPQQEMLHDYLFQPIVDTPDPFGKEASYARHHEAAFEQEIAKVGIKAEPLYQAKKYRAGEYTQQIKLTLQKREEIREILNRHRSEPLEENWWPVSVYSQESKTDRTTVLSWDGGDELTYKDDKTGNVYTEKITGSKNIKLPWRMDWPMRWAFEKVDFEPGGKDHSSQGGSYDTAKEIVGKIYGGKVPLYLQYDFVSIKGAGGKMSSSSGEVITVNDVLEIYEPEMVRWIFASYKSNVDFSISFDLDVVKVYEDFDRQERLAFGVETGNEKKMAMAKRVYELSQLGPMPEQCPFQPSFRHLCNILQIHDGNLVRAREFYASEIKNPRDERRFTERATRAWFWINHFAPEDFKFRLQTSSEAMELSPLQIQFLTSLRSVLEREWDDHLQDKALHERLYQLIHEIGLEPTDAFTLLYQKLINREKGPKLAGFLLAIGKERVLSLL